MFTVHVAGKVIKMATLPPVIKIPIPVNLGLDIANYADPTFHIDYEEYEFAGDDCKGEFYYRVINKETRND